VAGGDPFFDKARNRWSGTGVGTNAGVTVTQSAPVANRKLTCSGIQCSGDAAALVTIESPSSTVLWRKRFAAAFTMDATFPIGQIVSATDAQAMLVKISASTSNCEANIQGFTI
jgi:hypothetical protein